MKQHLMFRQYVKCLAILSVLILAGCETTYHAPSGSKLAQLRIAASQYDGTAKFRAVYYRNNNCDQAEVLGIGGPLGDSKSDPASTIPKPVENKQTTYFDKFIEASDLTSIRITSYAFQYSCSIPVSFATREGHMYELTFSWIAGCHADVHEIGGGEQASVKIPVPVSRPVPECTTGFKGPISP